jgi:hypothetical protein
MLVRLPNRALRLTVVGVALVLATVLAYFSVRNARADFYSGLGTSSGYERAVQLESGNPQNWYLLGRYWQYNLDQPDAQRAIQYYRAALSLNPRSADTWMDLGTAYESESDAQSARDAFLQARRVYPASADVSWRYGNFLLRQGEIPQAFAEIRRAAYADPKRGVAAFSRCWRANPDIHAILDQVLPPDRNVYLDVIRELSTDEQFAAALIVWTRLVGIRPRLNLSEAIYFTDELIHQGQMSDARRVWDDAVRLSGTTPSDPSGSVLWDGGFETGVQGGGFSWSFAPPPRGAKTTLDSKEKHSGRQSLRVDFDGRHNVNFDSVCNNAEVRPDTRYRFSAWVRTQSLTTDQGIRLRLAWAENSHNTALETSDVQGTTPWTQIDMPWTAPKDTRRVFVCVVRHVSGKLNSQIQGTAWIDDVALIPESAGKPKP